MLSPSLDENIKSRFPKKIEVYTDHGSFSYNIGDVTREGDIVRVAYQGSTYEKTGDPLADGEPDYVNFDIHFIRKGTNLKTIVNITYGDAMVSEFSLETPNKIKVGHYEGIDSKSSPETHFGFTDSTLNSLVQLFNSFDKNYKFTISDFKFIDKYFDTYQHNEKINLMPLSNNEAILLIDNSKPPKHRFITNLKNYLTSRGINFVQVSNLEQAEESIQMNKIIGVVMSGSDHNIDNSPEKQKLFKWAITNFTCPTIAICYAAQSMMKHYGATIYRGKLLHDNLKFTDCVQHHLLDGIDCNKYQFNFSFRDYIKEVPKGFEVIAKVDNRVVLAANDEKKEYALFFHPENIEFTHKVLDNFIRLIHPAQAEQEKITGLVKENVLKPTWKKIKSFNLFCESTSETSEELMAYLKTNFETGESSFFDGEKVKKWIVVDEKLRFLEGNKKYLVDKIYSEVKDDFKELAVAIIRRTIKRFLDNIS